MGSDLSTLMSLSAESWASPVSGTAHAHHHHLPPLSLTATQPPTPSPTYHPSMWATPPSCAVSQYLRREYLGAVTTASDPAVSSSAPPGATVVSAPGLPGDLPPGLAGLSPAAVHSAPPPHTSPSSSTPVLPVAPSTVVDALSGTVSHPHATNWPSLALS